MIDMRKIWRVLQVILIPFKAALIIIPLIILMVYTNYTIDSSGLYLLGDEINRAIVELLLADENVTNYGQIEERSFLSLYSAMLPEEQTPEILALGSSRVLQLRSDVFTDSFYNAGMMGADYRDVMNQIYTFDKEGKLPETVIIGIDPWFFRGDEEGLEMRADEELYNEFLSVALGKQTDYEPAVESDDFIKANELFQQYSPLFLDEAKTLYDYNITSETLSALFEVAYFQGNLNYQARTQSENTENATDGDDIPFKAISDAEMQNAEMEIKLADGSVFYAESFRNATEEEILALALEQSGTFLRMIGYTELDTTQTALFEEFVEYLKSKDINVYFFLAPYHPFTYEFQNTMNMEQVSGFFEIEPYILDYAQSENIPVIGSYDPTKLGLEGTDFFDGLHVKPEGIAKFFGGISENGEVLAGTTPTPEPETTDE